MERNATPPIGTVTHCQCRRKWAATRTYCWVCGITANRTLGLRFPPGLCTHHIAHGSSGRSDEPCNFFRCCHRDHQRIHGEVVVVRGKRWLPISPRRVWDLKEQHDPEHWDPDRLLALWGRATPPEDE